MTIEVPRAHQIFVNARAILWREGENGIEYVVQMRDRPGQRQSLEFPGGTVEAHESLLTALRREVREETGLEVEEIEGRGSKALRYGVYSRMSRTLRCLSDNTGFQRHGRILSLSC